MERIQLSDILVEPVNTSPASILGKSLGDVSKEQLMGVIAELAVEGVGAKPARALPAPITFMEDEE